MPVARIDQLLGEVIGALLRRIFRSRSCLLTPLVLLSTLLVIVLGLAVFGMAN